MTAVGATTEDGVAESVRRMNLIRLEWVRRQLPDDQDIGELYATVAAVGTTADPVTTEARFAAWLDRLIRLLDRRALELLPDGYFRATCAEARNFMAAVRCLHPATAELSTGVRVDATGTIPLPGAGLLIELPLSYAGTTVHVCGSARPGPIRIHVDVPGAVGDSVATQKSDPVVCASIVDTPGPRRRAGTGEACPSVTPVKTARGWAVQWTAAGGRLRGPSHLADRLPDGDGKLDSILAEVGCQDGIRVNRLADRTLRADASIDHLSLLYVRDRKQYDVLAERLDAVEASDAGDLLHAHRAYIGGDMATAGAGYADLLVRYPHSVDLWRDLTFAVRHLGDSVPGETWLFHPDEVVSRATACMPDTAPLSRILPTWRAEVSTPALWYALGLLEWVRHDFDHR